MKAPDKIYLQVCGVCPEEDCKNCKFEDLEDNVTWCKDRIYKKDIEYIRKDALLEWAKEKVNEIDRAMEMGSDELVLWGQRNAFKQMIDKIGSM